jgi:hypothetical protein
VQVEHRQHDAQQVDQDPDRIQHVVPIRTLTILSFLNIVLTGFNKNGEIGI